MFTSLIGAWWVVLVLVAGVGANVGVVGCLFRIFVVVRAGWGWEMRENEGGRSKTLGGSLCMIWLYLARVTQGYYYLSCLLLYLLLFWVLPVIFTCIIFLSKFTCNFLFLFVFISFNGLVLFITIHIHWQSCHVYLHSYLLPDKFACHVYYLSCLLPFMFITFLVYLSCLSYNLSQHCKD